MPKQGELRSITKPAREFRDRVRISAIARARTAQEAADRIGIERASSVRRWLTTDLERLRLALVEASTWWAERQRYVLQQSTEADYARLKKLESRCVKPWVIGFAERWGVSP